MRVPEYFAARARDESMRLDLINFRGVAPIAPGSSTSLLAEWRVGTLLEAVAVRDSATGQLFLNMGGQRYPARLASGSGDEPGPADGERMQLRVLRNSPVLALERIPDSLGSAPDTEAVADALRKFVPRQTSPAPLLSNLAWVARGAAGAESLPKAVAQMAERLWQAIPDTESMSDPMRLERALSRSGTFLEAVLAKDDGTPAARAAVASDIKALMLQFARVLRDHGARPNGSTFADSTPHAPLPMASGPLSALSGAPATLALLETSNQQMNELARQTDGALARISTTQVANSAQDGPMQALLVELPVRHEDRASMLRVRIEHEQSRRQQDAPDSWTVEAALDLGAVGALHARVSLSGFRVGVQLRADSPAVVELLNARAPELESMLRDAGLEVDRIVCRHGMPASDAGPRMSRLLDVRA
jgi:Flagellar hook-length control protein FliK